MRIFMNGESKMKNKVVKIIMWILFWFYLIPYYLVKKFLFKKAAHPIFWANCVTIGLFFVLGLVTSPSSHNTSQQSTQKTTLTKSKKVAHKTITKTITKKVGTTELNKEKARAKVLTQEEKNKQAEYDKLKKQLDDYQVKEEKQKQEAERERKAAEAQAQKEAAAKKKEIEEAQKKAKQNQEINNNGSSSQSQGDLYTANQGTIVGNRNSKIYHVPGQAGYHMHSANAVYFNSEQDAINAGYRKAKR
ncbi:DNA-entry nuclease [Lactobacillus sp. RTP31084st1_D4_RTP31084_210423]|uniref:sunset domain-containing protein n=1 Tax=unclassified Lactobacillus TaxID=2620435 RepID=UPI0034A42269